MDQIDKQIRALYRELVLLLKQINDFWYIPENESVGDILFCNKSIYLKVYTKLQGLISLNVYTNRYGVNAINVDTLDPATKGWLPLWLSGP